MGDFERTFGAGANIESIIDGINRDYFRDGDADDEDEDDYTPDPHFTTYEEALTWAKSNPGEAAFVRNPYGPGFIRKKERPEKRIPPAPIRRRVEERYLTSDALDRIGRENATWRSTQDEVTNKFGGSITTSVNVRMSHLIGLETEFRDAGYALQPVNDNIYLVEVIDEDSNGGVSAALLIEGDTIWLTCSSYREKRFLKIILGS